MLIFVYVQNSIDAGRILQIFWKCWVELGQVSLEMSSYTFATPSALARHNFSLGNSNEIDEILEVDDLIK
jgi:hypothetical protein